MQAFSYLVAGAFLFPGMVTESVKEQDNQIVIQILKNHPNLDKEYAEDLATVIVKVSKEFDIKPTRLTAILAQESMYRLNAVNHKSKDYGIAQINIGTVRKFGFDKDLLLTDLEYSVKAGAIVLADFRRMYGKREKDYWTRYNSSDPDKRKEYEVLVARYM